MGPIYHSHFFYYYYSKALTNILDLGARTNPDSRETSTITMLDVTLLPM